MKDDVLQRAMFAGNMATPVPPTADGVGITSGLNAPMPLPEAPPQQDMQQTLTGLEQVGGMIQNMQQGVDSAEDFESMINAMRSDEQPIEARRAELADMVGNEDATATPESVLTLLQPTFEILETLEQSVPQGGIGGIAPAMGEDVSRETMMPAPPMPPDFPSASSEYIQAPGTEEAMARMAMGEQPVRRNRGSNEEAEISALPVDDPANPYLKRPDYLAQSLDLYQSRFPQMPQLIEPSIENIEKNLEERQKLLGSIKFNTQERDAANIAEARQKLLSPYLTAPRTKEDILAEQQEFFGTADQDALKTQTGLALAKYFSQVPGEGTLLQNLVRPAGAFAEDLSKITTQKAALDRQAREFAYTTAQEERQTRENQNLQIMSEAINTADDREQALIDLKNQMQTQFYQEAVGTETERVQTANNLAADAVNQAAHFAGLEPLFYGKFDENGLLVDLKSGRRTPSGAVMGIVEKDGQKEYKDLDEEGYTRVPATTANSFLSSKAVDMSKAKAQNFVIMDPNSELGYRQVSGF